MWQRFIMLAWTITLTACTTSTSSNVAQEGSPSSSPKPSQSNSAVIAQSIAAPDRPAADRAEDAWRQPATVLDFLRVRPGMRVIDVFSAGGYYSELLAHAVGASGRVIAYNNPPYAKFAGDHPAERFGSGRLPNVQMLTSEVGELALPANSLDAALFVLAYHDAYWRPSDGSWDKTDPAVLLQKLYAGLKPGAVVVVLDHAAAAGSEPQSTVEKLHRIDPAVVKQDFAKAGFAFDGESNAFAHPDDDLTRPVFDPSIRHKTNQFLFRFRKPG